VFELAGITTVSSFPVTSMPSTEIPGSTTPGRAEETVSQTPSSTATTHGVGGPHPLVEIRPTGWPEARSTFDNSIPVPDGTSLRIHANAWLESPVARVSTTGPAGSSNGTFGTS